MSSENIGLVVVLSAFFLILGGFGLYFHAWNAGFRVADDISLAEKRRRAEVDHV